MSISRKLGLPYLEKYLIFVMNTIVSPFLLQDLVWDCGTILAGTQSLTGPPPPVGAAAGQGAAVQANAAAAAVVSAQQQASQQQYSASVIHHIRTQPHLCLLYTSDAADE